MILLPLTGRTTSLNRSSNRCKPKLTAVVVLLLATTSCGGPDTAVPMDRPAPEKPSAAYVAARDEALDLGRQGRFREATIRIGDALAEAPDLREPYAVASGLYQEGLNDPGAIDFFGFMTHTMPDRPWPWFFTGLHQARLGLWSDAAASFREAAALLPDHAEVHFYLGRALEEAGEPAAALAAMKRARELDPAGSAIAASLTRLLALDGKLVEAEKVYQETRLAGGISADLLYALAVLRRGQSRLDEAEIALRDAIRMKPDHLKSHLELVDLLERSGRTEESRKQKIIAGRLEDYVQARRLWMKEALAGTDMLPCLAVAELELTEGNVEPAMIWFSRAELIGGVTDRLLAGKAETLFARGEIEAGDRALSGVRRPADPRVALARAVRFLSTDDATMARVQLDKAVQGGPQEREFLRRASDLYEAAGFHTRSLALLERAAQAEPAYPTESRQ